VYRTVVVRLSIRFVCGSNTIASNYFVLGSRTRAPPAKEWESNKKESGNKIRTEIEDEWDEDGNLKRTTTKHITTPDWKKTTETTVEIIPAAEAEKMGLGKQ
jgi:hypothetical protein